MSRSGITGSYGSKISSFLSNLHTAFHTGCTSLHSHQHCVRVLVSPHPHQHLLLLSLIMAIITGVRWNVSVGFQDGCQREEAESVLPKVKSWRDTGDKPYRKNHWEKAKLWLLHTLSPRIASPLHIKWRNQEGSRTAKRQHPDGLGRRGPQSKVSGTWISHRQPWPR
jgi:hypothetical protein